MVFHSLYMYISLLPEQGEHCVKLTQLFLFSFLYLHILPTVSTFDLAELKGKGPVASSLCLSLSFCCHFYHKWLVNTGK